MSSDWRGNEERDDGGRPQNRMTMTRADAVPSGVSLLFRLHEIPNNDGPVEEWILLVVCDDQPGDLQEQEADQEEHDDDDDDQKEVKEELLK